jgi:hypothetical protein
LTHKKCQKFWLQKKIRKWRATYLPDYSCFPW